MNRFKAIRALFKTNSQLQAEKSRELRRAIGSDVVSWAEQKLIREKTIVTGAGRTTLYDDFITRYPAARRYVTATSFKNRLKIFCQFNGLVLTTALLDGREYFTISKSIVS